MDKYIKSETVEAFKITSIALYGAGIKLIGEGEGNWVIISKDTMERMRPYGPFVGGYYIKQEDGYQGFQEAKWFEKDHALIKS